MDGKREIKRCIIITGMSGAGKSSALNVFEDQGFYAIDNLPPALLPQLMDVLANHPAAVNYGVAAVVDARGKELLNDLSCVVEKLREKGVDAEVLFINASDEALVRRYETTRRRHPLADGSTILQGIREERVTLSAIMEKADIVIDTSKFKLPEFKARVLESTGVSVAEPSVIVSSFGFKYGIPAEADFVFDMRFLPNPYYVPELRSLTGLDQNVQDYVYSTPQSIEFKNRLIEFVRYLLPSYVEEGKSSLVIGIGCTGGHHRSVALTHALTQAIQAAGYPVQENHRDLGKN